MSQPGQPVSGPYASPSTPHASRRGWPWGITLWLSFLGLVIIAAQGLREADPAFAILISVFTSLAAVVSWCVWLAFFSRYESWHKYWPLGLFGLAAVTAGATVRVERFSGNMVPRVWRWSWQKQLDEKLAPLNVSAPASGDVNPFEPRPTDFPRFLGPQGTGAVESPVLAGDWKQAPPKQLWKQPIGAGWSGFAVVGERAITMEQRAEKEMVTCYDVATGQPVWAQGWNTRFESREGGVGPRATPSIAGDKVFAMGAQGMLVCLELTTGKILWQHDVCKEFNAPAPLWGKSDSPLLDGNLVIVAPGGAKGRSVVAFDQTSGDFVWGGGDEYCSYASPVAGNVLGEKQILVVHEAHLAGHDPSTGAKLWEVDWPGSSSANASNSQPVVVGPDLVFISKGYIQGSAVFKITKSDSGWSAEQAWKSSLLKTKHTNVVTQGGFVYGLDQGILCCLDLTSGNKRWKDRKADYGHGQILRVADKILVLGEDGTLALVAVDPEKFVELGRIPALEGICWANFAISGNRLLLRNSEEMACFELPLAE